MHPRRAGGRTLIAHGRPPRSPHYHHTAPARLCRGHSEQVGRPVGAPDVAQRVADLADGGPRPQRVPHRVEHVVAALGGPAQRVQRPVDLAAGRSARSAASRLRWSSSIAGSTRSGSYALLGLQREPVEPDDDPLAGVDLLRGRVRRALDLLLLEAGLDRRAPRRRGPRPSPSARRASASTSSVIASTAYDPANGSTVAVTSVSYARTCWVRSASRAAFSLGSAIASSKELVCSDWVPPSTAASACTVTRTRLTSGCWAVSCTPAVWVWKRSICDFGFVAPNSSRMIRAQIRRAARNFATSSSSVVRETKKNASRGAEVVHVQPGADRGPDVLHAVGQRERDLLHGRRAGLGHVVAGDRDRVPARDLGRAVRERVGDQAERLRRRVDVRAAGDVLLQHVVLDRAVELAARRRPAPRRPAGRAAAAARPATLIVIEVDTSPSGIRSKSRSACPRPSRSRRRPCRPRRARSGCRSRSPSASAGRTRPTGPVVPAAQQLVVARVGLPGGAEPGVLPHRPGPLRVHRAVDAAGERVVARLPDPLVEARRRRRRARRPAAAGSRTRTAAFRPPEWAASRA